MQTTKTDFRQNPDPAWRAIAKGQTVTITDHGKPKARMVPVSRRNKQAAADALRALGLGNLPITPR